MSLQSFLEDISSTAPVDYDPERDDVEVKGTDSGVEDDEEAGNVRQHYVNVGRGTIRTQAGIELDQKTYAGKRVSRKDMFDDEQEEDEDDESEDEGDDNGAENGVVSEELESDEIQGDSEDDEEAEEDIGQGDDDDDDDNHSDEDDDEEEDEEGEDDDDEEDDEEPAGRDGRSEARLAKELEQLEVEEKKLIKTMSASAKSDVEKGHHVRAQITLWDGLLDSRIRIQRAVTVANRFPQPDIYSAFHSASEETQTSVAETSEELVSLVDDLLDLRTALISQNSHILPSYSAGALPSASSKHLSIPPFDEASGLSTSLKRKRDHGDPSALLETVWADIRPLDTQFKAYRDQTIDKWNSKVQVAAGIPLQKKFKAINQTVVSQINQILSDKPRLIKRSQLRRSDHLPLGQSAPATALGDDTGDLQTDDAHLANYDEEIFDDGDYYQQLLKELIESRITDSDDAILNGLKWAHFKSMKNKDKKKKRVDTKASKGRKVRFHVHDKLQNYMAPEPRGTWHDSMIDELFAGLLGQNADSAAMDVTAIPEDPAADGFRII
ncbi:apoptosis-antagonizing transcription factor [Powellomyces hirtus]|nr:apoptosis-antagonizing transcription factor [Powellomyces hirtus]